MSELPKIYHEKSNKEFNNNNKFFYSNNQEVTEINEDNRTVIQKINEIFSSPNYIYKATVEIKLKDKTVKKRIIGRNKDYIITMDNDLIPIKDIIDIKSIKNKK